MRGSNHNSLPLREDERTIDGFVAISQWKSFAGTLPFVCDKPNSGGSFNQAVG